MVATIKMLDFLRVVVKLRLIRSLKICNNIRNLQLTYSMTLQDTICFSRLLNWYNMDSLKL